MGRTEQVVQAAADVTGVTPEQMQGTQQGGEVSLARHLAAYVLREDLYLSFNEIAIALGCSDPSSVRYGWLKIHEGRKPLANLLLPRVRAAASISVPMQ